MEVSKTVGPTDIIVCPVCKGRLQERAEELLCHTCPNGFPRIGDLLDLRSQRGAERDREGWSLDEFEKAYESFGDYATAGEYARRAGVPDVVERYRYPRIKGRLLEWISSRRDVGSVLDIGCGGGDFLLEIEKRVGRRGRLLAGIDVVPVRVQNTLRKFEGRDNFIAVLGSAEELPFPAGQFDAITCTEVMEHVARPAAAFREISRVLRPGGVFCFSSPNRLATDLSEGAFAIPRFFRRLARGTLLQKDANPYDVPIGAAHLRRLFREAGLSIEAFELNVFLPHESYYQFLPAWLNGWIVRAGGHLESHAPALSRWLGLHYVIRARRAG